MKNELENLRNGIYKGFEVIFLSFSISCVLHVLHALWFIPEAEPNIIIRMIEIIFLFMSFLYLIVILINVITRNTQKVKGGNKNRENG